MDRDESAVISPTSPSPAGVESAAGGAPLPTTTTTIDAAAAQPRYRKNGKLQSCEPCRKSKLRCDHQSPCGRCARLGRSDKCYFHPAPLSRTTPKDGGSGDERPHKRPRTVPESTLHRSESNGSPVFPSLTRKPSNPGNPLALRTGGTLGYRRSRGMGKPKLFYGPTAHSAILQENRATFGGEDMEEEDEEDRIWSNPKLVNFGTAILEWMPSQSVAARALRRYYAVTFSISTHEHTIRYFHDSFWAIFGSRMGTGGQRKQARLAEVAEELSKNTYKTIPQNPVTNDEFLRSQSGRWETVGFIMLVFGSLVFMIPENDPQARELVPEGMTSKEYAISMLECADACLMVCDELNSQSNIVAVMLFYRCCCLQGLLNVEGDTSLDLWRRAGSLLSTITGHGLHQLSATSPSVSILFAEHQKRIFAVSFMWVMHLSAFLGRPPPLSSRYALSPPPLDVSDRALMTDDLASLLAGLDANGWNTAGKIYPATIVRASYMSSFMYEDILEISLGQPLSPSEVSSRIAHLRLRLANYKAQLPPIFRTPITKKTFDTRSVWEVTSMAQIQLANTHQVFLLERIDHPAKDEKRHLEAAALMLNIVIVVWNERDRMPEHLDELHWAITCYGIPAASALGIALWKAANNPAAASPTPRRAEIIMDLSVFLTCLDWISPNDGNYVLCKRSRKLIKHILDGILDPQPQNMLSGSRAQETADSLTSLESLGLGGFGFGGDGQGSLGIGGLPEMPGWAGLEEWFMADWASAPRADFGR